MCLNLLKHYIVTIHIHSLDHTYLFSVESHSVFIHVFKTC